MEVRTSGLSFTNVLERITFWGTWTALIHDRDGSLVGATSSSTPSSTPTLTPAEGYWVHGIDAEASTPEVPAIPAILPADSCTLMSALQRSSSSVYCDGGLKLRVVQIQGPKPFASFTGRGESHTNHSNLANLRPYQNVTYATRPPVPTLRRNLCLDLDLVLTLALTLIFNLTSYRTQGSG